MIESEENSSQPPRFTWLTPMVVMWATVVIVIALIVLGTWLNKRKAAFDTHEAREKLEAIVREAKFTPQQAQTLAEESDAMLDNAGLGIARREAATRWFHRMEQSLACVEIEKKTAEVDSRLRATPAGTPRAELLKQWEVARKEARRAVYAIDRADADPDDVLKELTELVAEPESVTAEDVSEFADECRKEADKAKAPADPQPFDLYDSLHRGIVESKENHAEHPEKDKAAQR